MAAVDNGASDASTHPHATATLITAPISRKTRVRQIHRFIVAATVLHARTVADSIVDLVQDEPQAPAPFRG
jgi:hypothetical protein